MRVYGAILPRVVHLARLSAEPFNSFKAGSSEIAKRRLKVIQWYEEHGGRLRLTAHHFGFSPDTISR